jgi:hypothetical protein
MESALDERVFPKVRFRPRPCATQELDGQVLTFQTEGHAYHLMDEWVFEVLSQADGTRSVEELAEAALGSCDSPAIAATERALAEFMELGLLEPSDDVHTYLLSRRTLGRGIAATVLGAMGLPLVTSITAPDSASADSCLPEWDSGHECVAGESCRCFTGCCCQRPDLPAICADSAACRAAGSGYSCI